MPGTQQGKGKTSLETSKKSSNFTFRGLGCTSSAHVSVPNSIRTAADWDHSDNNNNSKNTSNGNSNSKNNRIVVSKKKNNKNGKGKGNFGINATGEVCCGPGIGMSTDAASVDCVVVSRRGARAKVDHNRERERLLCSTRRIANPEPISLMDLDDSIGVEIHSGYDVFRGSRYHRHVRHPSPEGFAEIMMLHSGLMMGGRYERFDRYRELRLDVDHMSYEELVELGERIGHVNTGLKEDDIVHCLRETRYLGGTFSQFPTETEGKCSICQEDYEEGDEIGKLDCGHFYHINCVKQWLTRRNMCPICKTEVTPQ